MTKQTQEKIKKFYEVVAKTQFPPGKEIGLIIVKKETLADIVALAPNSNLVTSFELTQETNAQEVIKQLAETLQAGRWSLIRLHQWLDQKIYNQLYLLSKDGRMQFADLENWVTVEAPKQANIILVSTDEELGRLNYENIFDLVGPVLRI